MLIPLISVQSHSNALCEIKWNYCPDKNHIKERERYGTPKLNVIMSGSPVANPKSDADYSVFITK
jgi:hypothetical protein